MLPRRRKSAGLRLAHGWRLLNPRRLAVEAVRHFLRPAVRAVPPRLATRLGDCRIRLTERLESAGGTELSSRWTQSAGALEIVLATSGIGGHELAIELLLCLGEALWETTIPAEREAYWKLLAGEIEAGVTGEIDEDALREKRLLLSSRVSARSRRRFERYARASFAGAVAEYIHCLWHEVTLRIGPDHLPAPHLRRRLEMLARWFPPGRGYRVFARR
ncbi:MAG: hypothetical protein HY236_05905 [Acidobacteria bacterium]|nr:hypothetical protein [Acidobacteriota bacterium]